MRLAVRSFAAAQRLHTVRFASGKSHGTSKQHTEASSSTSRRAPFELNGRLNPPGNGDAEHSFTVRNPATGETVATVNGFSLHSIEECLSRAHRAQQEWQDRPAPERADLLRAWARKLIEHTDYLAKLMTVEMGKPLTESRGEVTYGASFISWFAEEALRVYGETLPHMNKNERIMVTRQPVGLCAAITPWNFPLAMMTRKAGPALAAGCSMVVKPASETPLTAIAATNLAYEAGIPRDVISVVTTDEATTKDCGKLFATSPLVRKLTFTGSTAVGKVLLAQAASTVKRTSMELGGNAPFIVFDDADLEAAVKGAVASRFRNAGQTCVCANRLYVQQKVADEFVERLEAAVKDLKVGNGLDEGVQVGPLISDKALSKVEGMMKDEAKSRSSKVIVGGNRHSLGHGFFEPTVVHEVADDSRLFQEEIFGPIAAVSTFKDEQEIIKRANNTRAGLVAYLFTKDLGRAMRMGERLEYGMVGINNPLISTAVAPFGGVKESGFGREGSRHGIEDYTDIKYWNIRY